MLVFPFLYFDGVPTFTQFATMLGPTLRSVEVVRLSVIDNISWSDLNVL